MRKNLVLIVALLIWFGCTAFQKENDSNTARKHLVKAAPLLAPQKLMVPPMAYDDSSITVIWSKPLEYSNVVSYNVYQNGSMVGNTKKLFYNITGLEPDSPYSLTVKAVNASGQESPSSNKIIQSTLPPMKVFNVTDYGAVGDGNKLNTAAIQKAIDECTPGGKVLIPAGTFVSGALFLKSDMTFQIDGTLRGSDNAADYPLTSKRFPYYASGNNYMGLINAYTEKYSSISNIRICGSGTVNGGSDPVDSITGHKNTILGNNQAAAAKEDSARADMITVKGVDGLYIAGLKLVNPAMHVIFISYSKNITVNGITVDTYDIHNADGIDLATSDTSYIFNSTFDAGDDCINFNAGVGADGVKDNYPDNNIRVFNCIAKRGHGGVVFGSFTAAWIQNVLVEDCLFDGTDIGLRFKTGTKQGGGARNVLCRDLTIKNIAKHSAIFFDSSYSCDYPSGGPGQFKDITVKNVACTDMKKYGIYINGLSAMPHTNLSISDVSIDGAKSGGAYIKYCTNSSFDTINMTNSRLAWIIDANSTSGLTFKNCIPAPDNPPKTIQATSVPAASPAVTAGSSNAVAALPNRKVLIVIVGDTTAKDNKGWGPGFKSFITDRAECINLAIGGRSSKSFIDENRWAKALALKGDYYLIQFGHNDESAKGESHTDPDTTYREFMTRYIKETRAIGAKPVLITSLVRRQWDPSGSGKINSSLTPYAETVKAIAAEKNVPLVDLHSRSIELCEQLGKAKCDELSPIKDNNQIDNTHLNANGSELFGKVVVEELIKAAPELKPCFRIEQAANAKPTAEDSKVLHIVLVGDSTVTDKQGWGSGFRLFLTDRAECINTARGGRSSKSFINEGHWTEALALKGDYYLIQFGHNDEPGKGERSTDPNTTYRQFMTRYIDETRAIGATPILVTSLVRRQWDKSGSGKINSSLVPYVEAVKELAKEKNVPLVDLHASSKQLCEQLGKQKCWEFSPVKDNNQIDNTHLNDKGSVIFAGLVVEELVKTVPELKPCFRTEPAQ
jgi:exo-poly-alpha-galacturonosidase